MLGNQDEKDAVHVREFLKANPLSSFIPNSTIEHYVDRKVPRIVFKDVSSTFFRKVNES